MWVWDWQDWSSDSDIYKNKYVNKYIKTELEVTIRWFLTESKDQKSFKFLLLNLLIYQL